ncbi:hypothetical protein BGZ51_007612 [Haplosporangium sp. Z 767]|nr:hypothetical protein BGZ51_007612 [Haplosporangium sp. Z 767]
MDSLSSSSSFTIHKTDGNDIRGIEEDDHYDRTARSLHDDSNLSNDTHGEIGLFLASGPSIAIARPGYAQITYSLIGTMVFCFMSSLGEMAMYLSITGSINTYGTRFFGPELGFMLGWTYWFSWAVTLAAELMASSVIISYWIPIDQCPCWLSLIKVPAVIVFIIVGFLYISGVSGVPIPRAPKPGSDMFNMSPFNGRFVNLFNVFLNAGFSFQGAKMVGIAAVMIPYNDLALANENGNILASPLTRIFIQTGISIGGDIVKAMILMAMFSAGNSSLYASSRALHTLSQEDNAPKFFSSVN